MKYKIYEKYTEKEEAADRENRLSSLRPDPGVHCCFSDVSEGSVLSGQGTETNTGFSSAHLSPGPPAMGISFGCDC